MKYKRKKKIIIKDKSRNVGILGEKLVETSTRIIISESLTDFPNKKKEEKVKRKEEDHTTQ